jgi:hypothetical protein
VHALIVSNLLLYSATCGINGSAVRKANTESQDEGTLDDNNGVSKM